MLPRLNLFVGFLFSIAVLADLCASDIPDIVRKAKLRNALTDSLGGASKRRGIKFILSRLRQFLPMV